MQKLLIIKAIEENKTTNVIQDLNICFEMINNDKVVQKK